MEVQEKSLEVGKLSDCQAYEGGKSRHIAVYRASRTARGLVDPVSALHGVQHATWQCREAPVPGVTSTS